MSDKLQPESTAKEVKMRFRSINTGLQAILAFHLFGEERNPPKIAGQPITIERN